VRALWPCHPPPSTTSPFSAAGTNCLKIAPETAVKFVAFDLLKKVHPVRGAALLLQRLQRRRLQAQRTEMLINMC